MKDSGLLPLLGDFWLVEEDCKFVQSSLLLPDFGFLAPAGFGIST
jgi:hypothetical protein